MAKRRRPKKRESPPEPAAADTPLRPGAEKGAEKEAAEGGGGGRPFRVPPGPAAQDEEAGAARRGGGGGRGGDVSSRAVRGPRRRGPEGGGQRGGGGGDGPSRSHSQSFPASRLRPPRARTACWERGRGRRPPRQGAGRVGVASGPPSGARSSPPRPAGAPRSGPRRGGSWERGSSLPRYTDTRPARPGKHLTLEGRAVRCKQASNPGPGCPFARGRAHTLALRVHVRLPSPPCTTESENDKRA